MKVSRVSEMRAMDQMAIEQFGIPPEILMENAGHAAYFALRSGFEIRQKHFLVFSGLGNNGGDGFVLARKIHANGGHIQVMIMGDPAKFQGSAKKNYEILSRMSIHMQELKDIGPAKDAIADCDMVIDAIFGTGLSRDVGGRYREIIELINASHKPVLSIDIPSGVHGDTGKMMGAAIKADLTVTFGLPKLGNVLSPGRELGGKLFVSHISFPPSLHQSDALKIEINCPLPLKNLEGRQSTLGQLLSIGKTLREPDSPNFAAISFKNSGMDDPSSVARPRQAPIPNTGGEMMVVPQEETDFGSIAKANEEELLSLAERADMVVLGPGLSRQEENRERARDLTSRTTKPVLIDGDGITAFCEDLEILRNRKGATILTVHLEQMPCICSKSLSEIDEHKVDILQETAAFLNAIIVLRGAQCLIGLPDQRVFIQVGQNLKTATADDMLTWSIAAMHCQGLLPEEAVRQGVFLHGLAADMAAQAKGKDGFSVHDIFEHLPSAIEVCQEGLSEALEERYSHIHQI